MKCDKHPEMDAIGSCVYCGRGVCEQCKVRVNELLHCKECAEAGRIRGGRQPMPQVQYQPMVYPYPYLQTKKEYYVPPRPIGTPDAGLFRIGAIGCVLGFLLSIVCAVAVPLITLVPNMIGFTMIFFSLAMMPIVVGYQGFYRNYGVSSASAVSFVLLICLVVNIIAWAFALASSGYTTNNCIGAILVSSLCTGVGLLAIASPLTDVSYRIKPGMLARKDLQTASTLLLVAGLLFLSMVGMFIVGWVLLALALNYMSGAFLNAPMPGAEDAAVTPGYVEPVVAPMKFETHEEAAPPKTMNTIVERVDDEGRIF